MKKLLKIALLTLIGVGTVFVAIAQEANVETNKGKVNATTLNVRVKPSQNYTSVGYLKNAEEVEIIRSNGSWFEIKAPDSVAVWVAADAVKDGKIIKTTPLRGGPGVEHQSYRQVQLGQEVKVVDASRKLWLKIKPLPELTAWVSAKYITVAPSDIAKIPGAKDIAQTEKPEKPSKKVDLPYVAGSEKSASMTGVIQPVDAGSVITHALCKSFKEPSALAYILSKKVDLKKFETRKVKIEGKSRLVSNWSVPVLEVEKITVITD